MALVSIVAFSIFDSQPFLAAKAKKDSQPKVEASTKVAPKKKTKTKKTKKSSASQQQSPLSFVERTAPVIEFVPQASIPVGYLAKVYKGGGGFRFGFHFKLPLKKEPKVPIEIRMGLQLGMGFYPSYRGLVIGVPMYPELALVFPVGVASPYMRLGAGMMVAAYIPSAKIKEQYSGFNLNKASADGLIAVSLGSFFHPPKVKNISILLELQFLTAFESRTGMFINIGFGIGYHFHTASK